MKILVALTALALLQCTQRASQPIACGSIDGVEQVFDTPGVFIGDMHGSMESPRFLGDLACHVMNTGRPLVVAMEYDSADQPVLDRFLDTASEQRASRLLTDTPHWKGNRDGRASSAMRDALLSIWRHARAGAQVELVAYDGKSKSVEDRDSSSAAFITEKRTADGPAPFWIVFGGNVHARTIRGLTGPGVPPGYESLEPLGYLIRDWGLIHLNAGYWGGASWGCRGGPDGCGIIQHGPPCTPNCPRHPAIRLAGMHPAYDGVYEVGALTPSPPLNQQVAAEK
jgi:hypothetical protein